MFRPRFRNKNPSERQSRCDSNWEGRALAILYRHTQRAAMAPVIGAVAIILLLDVGAVFSSPASAKAIPFILGHLEQ